MMPLTMTDSGVQSSIKKVGGNDDIRKFLKSLGFVVGSLVTVITKIDGNIIVSIKEARIAESKEIAGKIYV
jgi:ferrous iron transport protein A